MFDWPVEVTGLQPLLRQIGSEPPWMSTPRRMPKRSDPYRAPRRVARNELHSAEVQT